MDVAFLKVLAGIIVAGLVTIMLRDFKLRRVPAVRNLLSVSYARRDETPVLFWLFTIGRVAVVGFIVAGVARLG